MPAISPDPLDTSDLVAAYSISATPIVNTSKVVILLGSDDIYYLRYHPGAEIGLTDFREYEAKLLEVMPLKGERIGLLVDSANLIFMTKEARTAIAAPEVSERCYGLAIVVKSTFAQVLGGFFIFLEKPGVPTRLFTTVSEARQWLLKLKPGIKVAEAVLESATKRQGASQ